MVKRNRVGDLLDKGVFIHVEKDEGLMDRWMYR